MERGLYLKYRVEVEEYHGWELGLEVGVELEAGRLRVTWLEICGYDYDYYLENVAQGLVEFGNEDF